MHYCNDPTTHTVRIHYVPLEEEFLAARVVLLSPLPRSAGFVRVVHGVPDEGGRRTRQLQPFESERTSATANLNFCIRKSSLLVILCLSRKAWITLLTRRQTTFIDVIDIHEEGSRGNNVNDSSFLSKKFYSECYFLSFTFYHRRRPNDR